MSELWDRYCELRKANKRMYLREGAESLGVTEQELAQSSPTRVWLGGDVKPLALRMRELGRVKSIVRNSVATHEKTAVYENVTMTKTVGLALNVGELDLRFFVSRWKNAFAFSDGFNGRDGRCIRFFDDRGACIQQVFATEKTDAGAWDRLIADFRNDGLPSLPESAPDDPEIKARNEKSLEGEQLADFQKDWANLKDIHHFSGLLETYGLSKARSFCFAPEGMATKVSVDAAEDMLKQTRDAGFELMTFVGNRGIVQIQTGKIHNVVRSMGFLNVLDQEEERFCLHLKDSDAAEAWVCRRPTRDGVVTNLELFDDCGRSVASFFGRREEGNPEMSAWSEVCARIASTHAVG